MKVPEDFVRDHRRIADGGRHVRGQFRATRRRVVRLDELTEPQRRLILALVRAAA